MIQVKENYLNKFINVFSLNGKTYQYYDLKRLFEKYTTLRKLPNSLKLLFESNIRNAIESEAEALIEVFIKKQNAKQIRVAPTRVVLGDSCGLSLMMELAYIKQRNNLPINPKVATDLIIDSKIKDQRDEERIDFFKWASKNFDNFSIIPPSNIAHPNINIEFLSTMLSTRANENGLVLFPEMVVGCNHHTSLANALGILGLKQNEVDLQASILGNRKVINLPRVVGVEVLGTLNLGVSFDEIINSIINTIKEYDVKDKIVEFYGKGIKNLSIENRAVISKAVSDLGALNGYFGVDEITINYIEQTRQVNASIIKEYFSKQAMFENDDLVYDEYIRLNLSAVKPIAYFSKKLDRVFEIRDIPSTIKSQKRGNHVRDNDVVLSVISTSSGITSIIQACLLAKKARHLGLEINQNVKRYFEIDSFKIKEYLEKTDLLRYLEEFGFELVLKSPNKIVDKIGMDAQRYNVDIVAVTSSKNLSEIINTKIKAVWYMSPAFVIAYSIKGSMNFDLISEEIKDDIYLSNIFPTLNEVNEYLAKINATLYENFYKDIYAGNAMWQEINYEKDDMYDFNSLTYLKPVDLYENKYIESIDFSKAKIIAMFGDKISTKHLIPKGNILAYTQTGFYLEENHLRLEDFDRYEKRCENAEVMKREIFSTSLIQNKIIYPKEGGYTLDFKTGETVTMFEYSLRAKKYDVPLVILAGRDFGIGDYESWIFKGFKVLGISAIIAKSFDENFKRNLIRAGILPLEFIEDDVNSLELKGNEIITIKSENIELNSQIEVELENEYFSKKIMVQCKFNSKMEIEYFKNGGILNYLIKNR